MSDFLRVRRSTAATIEVVFYDDEDPVDATGAVTVGITKWDGTELVAAGTATTHGATGQYTYSLAPQANLGRLTATWTGTFASAVRSQTTMVEVVGGFYAELAEIRTQRNVTDQSKWDAAALRAGRDWFETTFEDYVGQAMVPRYARETLSGNNGCGLVLGHYPVQAVQSVKVWNGSSWTAFTAPELADLEFSEAGVLTRRSGYWTYGVRNVVVEYEHGLAACPPDVKRVFLQAVRDDLLVTNSGRREVDIRQYGVQTDSGFIRTSTPGPDRPFGIPSVDEVANRYRAERRVPAVA